MGIFIVMYNIENLFKIHGGTSYDLNFRLIQSLGREELHECLSQVHNHLMHLNRLDSIHSQGQDDPRPKLKKIFSSIRYISSVFALEVGHSLDSQT